MFMETDLKGVTQQQIRADFEALLKMAQRGLLRTPSLVDPETWSALREVQNAAPNASDFLIRKARQQLEFQLDGTHDRIAE